MLKLKSVNLKKDKVGILVIPVCEDKDIHDNQTVSSLAKKAQKIKGFKGEKDDELTFYDPDQVNAEIVTFLGLGKQGKLDTEALRALAGKTVKKCIQKEFSDILIAVPSEKKTKLKTADILEVMLEGACLGNHLFDKYKKEKKLKLLKQINFLVTAETAKKFSKLPSQVSAICEGTKLAREWVSMPSNDKPPAQLAKIIAERAGKESLKVTVLDDKEIRKNKFGAMLAVAAGSQNRPRMVILEYRPKGAKKTVALVGKGITFDSGGLNLKPGGSMAEMKMDMAGGAAVAGTLISVAKLKPKMNIIGVIPLVENMPSGSATRPGDIIKTYEGKTVEIGNTDAEGRLILADAMAYAVKKYKPDTMIDLATLTGACIVALGEKIAGVFSSSDKLANAIISSGKKTYERCWHLPMPEDYKESLKSEFADTNNISKEGGGGSITAAIFLSEFVGKTRWAHIDIAGPAYVRKDEAYCGAGGTGFGVRLLCDLMGKL
ncbi:leucyl aminopeptidase [Desulfococcaceae bacterium HSG8]|nr:leucyl aminopeptidase [Desulfococcaceae bacterium HSG8]